MKTEGEKIKKKHSRRFLISAPNLFHFDCGYINIKCCKTTEEISMVAKHTLLNKLLDMNLMELYEENLYRNFHIDDHVFDDIFNGNSSDIFNGNSSDIFYICSHNEPGENTNNEPGETHMERRHVYLTQENERRNSIVDADGNPGHYNSKP